MKVSVVTPCFNEEGNVAEIYLRVREQMSKMPAYSYEHLFIDNASSDGTLNILRSIASTDPNVKVIVNSRNFGSIRSSMHALMEADGDAVIGIVADMQDPPELIPEMIEKWRQGYSMVLCVKRTTKENPLMAGVRKSYYQIIRRLSSINTFDNFTGFALLDRTTVEAMRSFHDPYPYIRGMIAEIGLPFCEIPYDQPVRMSGRSKHNLYALYDLAMLGITQLSKVPLRFVTFIGFVSSAFCVVVGLVYLLYKLFFWSSFTLGLAPLVIGVFLFASVQMLSLGIMGEYIATILTQVQRRPYVIERERINFERDHAMVEPFTVMQGGSFADAPRSLTTKGY